MCFIHHIVLFVIVIMNSNYNIMVLIIIKLFFS